MIVPIIIAALAIRSVEAATYIGCVDPANVPAGSSTTISTDVNACIAWILNTPFGFSGCYSQTVSQGRTRTTFPSSPEGCLANCATYEGAALSRSNNLLVCQCADTLDGDGAEVCQPASASGGFYLYGQSLTEPTALARRQLRERLRRAQIARNQYCPSSLTACMIGCDHEAFEADLEACGGCMNGLYGPTVRNAIATGVDCSALPNVALGGVTCTRGQCEVSACKYGYALVDNQCVRML
uniref:Protein CPL1-like domain-containing protein n=1 Tax=Kwoniella bestiolae CBS 10118 TaxID=1296100 RepID=A0A1B9GG73_9TREE|nr:hypothetical protein I302_01579 [Kwoniella bestiolae CBS 10118]OCF30060.1 hypothetical protein I302_01579 [Kwoniella bestiolae CBS 10118]